MPRACPHARAETGATPAPHLHIAPPPSAIAPAAARSPVPSHSTPPEPPATFSTPRHIFRVDRTLSPASSASPTHHQHPIAATSPALRSPRHISPDRKAPSPAPQKPAHDSDQFAWPFPVRPVPVPNCVASGSTLLARTIRPDAPARAASLRPHISPPLSFCPRLALAIPFRALPLLSARATVFLELPQYFRR